MNEKINALISLYAGRRFGERVTMSQIRFVKYGSQKQLQPTILCRCDKGHEKWIQISLIKCGRGGVCRRCQHARFATRHGQSKPKTPCYKKWARMWERVRDKEGYIRRGISVCDRWKIFENFASDMGEIPDPRMELDRKDGTKGYYPENCRWATRLQNAKNKSNFRMISYGGMTMCVAHWEEYLNLKPEMLRKKLRSKRPLESIMKECGFVLDSSISTIPPT